MAGQDNRRSPMGESAFRPKTIGVPKWVATDLDCPFCMAKLCQITVEVEPPPMLRTATGKAQATYHGCPACTFAGPSITTAMK